MVTKLFMDWWLKNKPKKARDPYEPYQTSDGMIVAQVYDFDFMGHVLMLWDAQGEEMDLISGKTDAEIQSIAEAHVRSFE